MTTNAPARPVPAETLRRLHKRQGGLLNLEELLIAAQAAENGTASTAATTLPEPAPEADRPTQSGEGQSFTWGSGGGNFGKVTFRVEGFRVGKQTHRKTCAWAELTTELKQPATAVVFTELKLPNGVTALFSQGPVSHEVTGRDIDPFQIRVDWVGGRHQMPKTREKDKDNFDITLVTAEGESAELQVSVVTRSGRFYICLQEVYMGQIVRTNEAGAIKLGLSSLTLGAIEALVVPLYPENAYPGSDFLVSNAPGQNVVEHAIKRGASMPLSRCRPARWETPKVPDQVPAGWSTATVKWFNLVLGFGFVTCADGVDCFVHMNTIVDTAGVPVMKSEFPVLEPMKCVLLQHQPGQKGGRQATAVQKL